MSKNIIRVAVSHIIVLLGTGGTRTIAFLTSIVLARTLGADSYGQFSLFQSAMFICWQIPVAFDTAFIRYAKAGDGGDQFKHCLAAATRLKIFFVLAMGMSAFPIAAAIESLTDNAEKITFLIGTGMICGCFLSFIHSIANTYRAKEKFGKYSLIQALYNFSIFIAICTLAYALNNISVTNSISTFLIIAFIFGGISLWMVINISGNPFKALPEYKKLIFSLSRWSILIALAYYIFCRVDILTLSHYVKMTDVGIYSAAFQLTLTVSILIAAMGTVFLPRAVQATKSFAALKSYLAEAVIPIFVVLFGILFLYIIAPYIFYYLFTSEYSAAADIFRILLIGYIAPTLYNPFAALFYSFDKPHILFILDVSRLLMALIFLNIFIPIYGISGAAYSFVLTMSVYSITATLIMYKILTRHFSAVNSR